VCGVFFVLIAALNLLKVADRTTSISTLGVSFPGTVEHVRVYQFLTAPLIHANVTHLVFNMLALWMLGPSVEKQLGRSRYLVFSATCAAASTAGFLVLSFGTGQIVIGYSGVIFGIFVAQAVFFPHHRIAFFAFFPIKMKYAVLLMAAVELYLTISPEDATVAHAAHLFGAGAAFIFLKLIPIDRTRSGQEHVPVVTQRWVARRTRTNRRIPRKL